MALADGADAHHEPQAARRYSRLVGMGDACWGCTARRLRWRTRW